MNPRKTILKRLPVASLAGLVLIDLLGACTLGVKTEQCSVNSDCAAAGLANSFCTVDRYCAPILSEDCPTLIGGPMTDDTILIGQLTALTGPNASFGEGSVPAAKLALDELALFSGGIPTASGRKRSLAMVVCDHEVDAVRPTQHLADDLKVPAILGPVFSALVRPLAEGYTIPAGVLLLNSYSVAPELTHFDKRGLFWRTSMSDAPEPSGMALLLQQIEQDIRLQRGLKPHDLIRVAVIAKGDLYGQGLANQFYPEIQINGTTEPGADTFMRIDFPDLKANPTFDTNPLVDGGARFRPDIVLVFGAAEMVSRAVGRMEEVWPALNGSLPPPHYIVSEALRLRQLRELVGLSARALSTRLQVFSPQVNPALFAEFQGKWRARIQTVFPDSYGAPGTYDAVYLVAYAMAAADGPDITGRGLAEGLKRLVAPANLLVRTGPGQLAEAFSELRAGRNIDVDGVSGKLDFDLELGEAPNDYDISCLHGSPVAEYATPMQRYDTLKSQLVGAYAPCP